MESKVTKAELLDRHLNNAAIYTSNGKFEEAFLLYQQITEEHPAELRGWHEWLSCCYRWIETEQCVFFKEDAYDVRTMKRVYEQVLQLAAPEEREPLTKQWNEFWTNVADAAWAGSHSLFHVKRSDYAYEAPFELFAKELSLLGEIHPRLAEVIAEGCQLAEKLTKEGVCFWQVEYLKVDTKPGIWQVEHPKADGRPMKGTCYDWFPLRPEFHSRLEFVLGSMCLHRREDPRTQNAAAGVLVYLARAIPMDDIKLKEFRRYAQWRWNATKHCPYCGTKLVGMFRRSCINCNRDVSKIKVR